MEQSSMGELAGQGFGRQVTGWKRGLFGVTKGARAEERKQKEDSSQLYDGDASSEASSGGHGDPGSASYFTSNARTGERQSAGDSNSSSDNDETAYAYPTMMFGNDKACYMPLKKLGLQNGTGMDFRHCYVRNIACNSTEKRLQREGDYLLRFSLRSGKPTLSVRIAPRRIEHYVIEIDEHGLGYIQPAYRHHEISSLILRYIHNTLPGVDICLRNPCGDYDICEAFKERGFDRSSAAGCAPPGIQTAAATAHTLGNSEVSSVQ